MNIFFLDHCPRKCAQYHCDKHVVKMIVETCQILCTVWHIIDPEHKIFQPPYRKTHINHPCTIWARSSRSNYIWLSTLGMELCKEYSFRYEKSHKSEAVLQGLMENIPDLPCEWSDPPKAMPDEYKVEDCIDSYRRYYKFGKRHLHTWKKRHSPFFIKYVLLKMQNEKYSL